MIEKEREDMEDNIKVKYIDPEEPLYENPVINGKIWWERGFVSKKQTIDQHDFF